MLHHIKVTLVALALHTIVVCLKNRYLYSTDYFTNFTLVGISFLKAICTTVKCFQNGLNENKLIKR